MAGESWKSHKNSALERDMDTDHDAQLSERTTAPGLEYLPAEIEQHERDQLQREHDAGRSRAGDVVPPRIVGTEQIMQEIRDEYARDIDPAVSRAWQEAIADWARSTARTIDLDQPAEADSVERLQARIEDLRRDRLAASTDANGDEENLRVAQPPTMTYMPPPVDPQYRPDADYPSAVVANTRVVPAETVDPWAARPTADTARFQTELAIAQQVAANQVRAQQHADAEAAERLAATALGQYIAPSRNAPARTPHR